jgi:WD40 repeat protein
MVRRHYSSPDQVRTGRSDSDVMFLGLVAIVVFLLLGGGGAFVFWRWGHVRAAREMAMKEELRAMEEQERARDQIEIAEKKLAEAHERDEVGRRIKPRPDNPSLDRGIKLCEQGDNSTGLLWLVRALEEAGNDADTQRAIRLNLAAWSTSQEKGQTLCKHSSLVSALAISADDQSILVGGVTGTSRIYDRNGKPSGEPISSEKGVTALVFDPDGKTILVATEDGGVDRLDRMTGKPADKAPDPPGTVLAFRFMPKGGLTMAGTCEKGLWLAEGRGRRAVSNLNIVDNPILCMALSADGKQGMIGHEDGTVHHWDLEDGKELAPPRRSEEPGNDAVALTKRRVYAVAWSSDEKLFLVGTHDKVRLVDNSTQIPFGPRIVLDAGLTCAVFTPDTKSLLTAGTDGEVKRWSIPQPLDGELARLKLWVQVMAGKELDAAGNVRPIDEATRNERQRQLGKMGGPPR